MADADWGWVAQRGTESVEDAIAAQSVVQAFRWMEKALMDRQATIQHLLEEIHYLTTGEERPDEQ